MRPLFMIAVITVAACSEVAAPGKTLVVEPPSLDLWVTNTAGLHVTAKTMPVWRSAETSVATVSSAGLVTTVSEGQTKVWAIIGRDSGYATVTVRAAKCLASVTVAPPNAVLTVGDSVRVTVATGCASTPSGFVWTSGDEHVATVARVDNYPFMSTATITARDEGRVAISAASVDDPAVTGVVAVTVRRP